MIKSDATNLNFTPVTEETFAVWCEAYKEKIRLERLSTLTGNEDKPTGKELFMQNRSAFDDITLDASADDDEDVNLEESKGGDAAQNNGDEEQKEDEDDDEEGEFVYDRALYDADGLDEDEDVDFDDDD